MADLYLLTDERLTAAGLPGYEVSNYAQPGKESQHNLNYWRSGDWVAIGPGAHGRLSTQQGRLVMENRKSPEGWLADVSANGHGCQQQMVETHRQSFEDYWMMGLRLNDGVLLARPRGLWGAGLQAEYTLAGYVFIRRLAGANIDLSAGHTSGPVAAEHNIGASSQRRG